MVFFNVPFSILFYCLTFCSTLLLLMQQQLLLPIVAILFSSHLSLIMYHHLPPQIKKKVLFANNLFVASYFQQTIANLHFCMPELHFPLCCLFPM